MKGNAPFGYFLEMDVCLLPEKLGQSVQILGKAIHGDRLGIIAALNVKAVFHCKPSKVQMKDSQSPRLWR